MQVVEMMKRVLGSEHPTTPSNMNNLAQTWKLQGKDQQALGLMRQCVAIRQRVLGREHPYTIASMEMVSEWSSETVSSKQKTACSSQPKAETAQGYSPS
jgi:Tetratricopeptide repeat